MAEPQQQQQDKRLRPIINSPAPSASDDAPRMSPRRVLDIASGYEPALILEAAVRLGVFDALDARPLPLDQVARKTETSTRGMRAILNALVGLDLLDKFGDDYALTAESAAYLVTTSPAYQGYMCKHVSRHLLPRWTRLTEVVRTGKPTGVVNEQADGAEYFREFVEDIFPMSYEAAQALAVELRLPAADRPVRVLDLAAGSGVWGVALAEASPHVRVTAVDWPAVLPVTRRVAERHKVAGQFRFVGGDVTGVDLAALAADVTGTTAGEGAAGDAAAVATGTSGLPGRGFDVATLGHILHSEGEARSRQLLRRTFDAVRPGGTVVVAEFIADDDRTGPPGALIFAVTMLVNTEAGDTFTFAEMAAWLREAGFVDPREVDVPGPAPLILATKPG